MMMRMAMMTSRGGKRKSRSSSSSSSSLPVAMFMVLLVWCIVNNCAVSDVVDAATFDDLAVRNFQCDEDLREITNPRPLSMKGKRNIRICIERNANLQHADVFILKLNEYTFQKDVMQPDGRSKRVKQTAVEAGTAVNPYDVSNDNNGNGDGSNDSIATTFIDCTPGSTLCSFSTRITNDDFFRDPGLIKGVGSVAVQFGDNNRRQKRNLLLRGSLPEEEEEEVEGQEQQEQVRRGLFAGIVNLALDIEVSMTDTGGDEDPFPELEAYTSGGSGSSDGGFKGYWNSLPTWAKVLYIVALILLILFLCCCLAACLFWDQYFHHVFNKDVEDDDEMYDDDELKFIEEDKNTTAITARSNAFTTDSDTHSSNDDGRRYDDDDEESIPRKALPSTSEAAMVPLPFSPRRSSRRLGSKARMNSAGRIDVSYDGDGSSPDSRRSSKMTPRKTPRKKLNSSQVDREGLPQIDLESSRRNNFSRSSSVKSAGRLSDSPRRANQRKAPRNVSQSAKTPRRKFDRSSFDLDYLPQLTLAESQHTAKSHSSHRAPPPPPKSPRTPKRGSSQVSTASSTKSSRSKLAAPPKSPRTPRPGTKKPMTAKSPRSALAPPSSPRTPRRVPSRESTASTKSPKTPKTARTPKSSKKSKKTPMSTTTPRRKVGKVQLEDIPDLTNESGHTNKDNQTPEMLSPRKLKKKKEQQQNLVTDTTHTHASSLTSPDV